MIQAIFHGHSFVEIQMESGSLLIDPFISGNPCCEIKINDILEKNVKAIMVSHGHNDHIGDSIEIAKKLGCLLIVTFELGAYLTCKHGLKNVHTMSVGGEYSFDDFVVKFVSALHGGGIQDMQNGYNTTPVGIIIKSQGKSIYHAGDTGLMYDMKLLGEYDKLDLAFLPIGGNYTMNVNDAVLATSFLKPNIVVPIHYNTWPIINADASEFAKFIMIQNLSIPKVLSPGQCVVLN